MKSILSSLFCAAVAVFGLSFSSAAPAQTINANTTQAGVTLLVAQPATATAGSGAVRVPNFSLNGTLTVTEAGITGSPSGCTLAVKSEGATSSTVTTFQTISFTPATGVQTFATTPSNGAATGDQILVTYACSSTYPTAGTITVSFSPADTVVLSNYGSLCQNPNVPKSSVSVAITTATTTQLVALSSGLAVHVCTVGLSLGASTTAQFEYGTGTTCGTGTTALTGAFAGAGILGVGGQGTLFKTPVSNALCVLSTGTGGIQGFVSYVQQ